MNDYCDQSDEVAKNPEAKRNFQAIAAGNPDAFRFMWALWNFSHIYDDLVDRDKEVPIGDAGRGLARLMEELSCNPFYLAHMKTLLPQMISTVNRWCVGDEWEKNGTPEQRQQASVVRCGDVDLYLTVAYLVGGWDHMRNMKFARAYDPEEK